MLRRLLTVMTEHQWPMPEVIAATQKARFDRLNAILQQMK
jgi:hypothetical protein